MSYSIGGADGPTSVFIAGQTGENWINIFGFIVIILMLLPNLIYAFYYRGQENKVVNKGMNLMEQIGRYASMFLMVRDWWERSWWGWQRQKLLHMQRRNHW